MEVWDVYDETFHRLENITLVRGEPIKDGMWEASVGGSALKGETPLACACRELQEETLITSVNLQEVGYIICKETHSIYVEYTCVVQCDKQSIQLQENETIAYRWVSKEEIKMMRKEELLTTRIQKFMDFSSSKSDIK